MAPVTLQWAQQTPLRQDGNTASVSITYDFFLVRPDPGENMAAACWDWAAGVERALDSRCVREGSEVPPNPLVEALLQCHPPLDIFQASFEIPSKSRKQFPTLLDYMEAGDAKLGLRSEERRVG